MANYTLCFSPGACSRVIMIALEEIGKPFETRLIKMMAREHRSPEYLALNPKGKVPTLLVDGKPLTENVAIQYFLTTTHPEAKLLPLGGSPWDDAKVLSHQVWCASTLHPLVTRYCMSHFFAADVADVRAKAAAAIDEAFPIIEERLANHAWWWGHWSLADAYIFWLWGRLESAGWDGRALYPHYAGHAERMRERPSVARALKREEEAFAWLKANGLLSAPASPAPKKENA